jgi:hypothetical protein
MPLKSEDIQKIEHRCNAASPEPWSSHVYASGKASFATGPIHAPGDAGKRLAEWDARFIEVARTYLPQLVAEVRRLRTENYRLRTQLDATTITIEAEAEPDPSESAHHDT